ncbi:MAG: hypothetical protein ACO3A2_11750 [Bdellovibrionia bacterium]
MRVRAKLFLRFAALLSLGVLPAVGFGGLILGQSGALGGLVLGLLGFAILSFQVERLLTRSFGPSARVSEGLKTTLQRVALLENRPLPRILVTADPLPSVHVARGWSSCGIIFISQGLLSQANEDQLRAILRVCLRSLTRPELWFQGLCAVLHRGLTQLFPKGVDPSFLGGLKRADQGFQIPSSAGAVLMILVLYPWSRFLQKLAEFSSKEGPPDGDLSSAKLESTLQRLPLNPAFFYQTCVITSWFSRRLSNPP